MKGNHEEKTVDSHVKFGIIEKLSEVINIQSLLNVISIDCGYELLRWSADPTVCKKRHNIIISSLESISIVKKSSHITIICPTLSESDFIRKMTALSMRKASFAMKPGNLVVLREEDVKFYLELMSLKGNMGKYRSNKKLRMMTKLGLNSDFELTVFFNMIFSLPYSMLRVLFLRTVELASSNRSTSKGMCERLRYQSLNIEISKNSFMLCTFGSP